MRGTDQSAACVSNGHADMSAVSETAPADVFGTLQSGANAFQPPVSWRLEVFSRLMTDEAASKKSPNLAKMTDVEYREHVARQKETSPSTAGVASPSPEAAQPAQQTGQRQATSGEIRRLELGLDSRNGAWVALITITIFAAVAGVIMLIAGGANMHVESFLSNTPTDPGLPWMIVGGALLNTAFLTGMLMLVVVAVRWRPRASMSPTTHPDDTPES